MLTPFPELLVFSFFAPALLRVSAACLFAYLAYAHARHRKTLGQVRFPILGKAGWIVGSAIVLEGAVAVALFAGYYTQVAALVGALIALKHVFWHKNYPAFFLFPRSTSFILIAVLVSLLLTGAGAFAFDLPL